VSRVVLPSQLPHAHYQPSLRSGLPPPERGRCGYPEFELRGRGVTLAFGPHRMSRPDTGAWCGRAATHVAKERRFDLSAAYGDIGQRRE